MSEKNNMKLFALNSNQEIAKKFRKLLGSHSESFLHVNSQMVKSKLISKKVFVAMIFISSNLPATLLTIT